MAVLPPIYYYFIYFLIIVLISSSRKATKLFCVVEARIFYCKEFLPYFVYIMTLYIFHLFPPKVYYDFNRYLLILVWLNIFVHTFI